MKNPFPGPLPYRASDRDRFFGRSDMAYKLAGCILANRCVTVYGPSGAGKSSLLQAAVLPSLIERHDARIVRVDAWPEGKEPTLWLATTLHAAVGCGELSPDTSAREAVLAYAKGAARASSRPLVIYLDQLEQLLYAGRSAQETEPLFDCIEVLGELPLRNVRVVLSLREDYLGRFRDRLRDLRRVTENGFRVGPLVVAELTEAMLLSAAVGDPPQSWDADEIRGLMLQVRVPGQEPTDEAEAQSAYAQIICRALFQERALGKNVEATEAEAILRGYLASTLAELGDLRDEAQRLLEDHLVGVDGSRTLRTEAELGRVVAAVDLARILKQLEGAAILRAEEHHASRYFEIGHDWLAAWVFEQRKERERLAEQKRIAEEQAKRLAEARAQQRRLRKIAAAAIFIATLVGAAAVVAVIARSQALAAQRDAEAARRSAEAAEKKASEERDEANDLRVMAGYRALGSRGDTAGAMKLLAAVKKPEARGSWIQDANHAIQKNALFVTLRGHRGALRGAIFSADGKRILTASDDHTARIWNADGTGEPLVLGEHRGAITYAAFLPAENPSAARVLTTSLDGTARLWSASSGAPTSIVLAGRDGASAAVTCGAVSPDGERVAIASISAEPADSKKPGDTTKERALVRVYAAKDGALLGEHGEHRARVREMVFIDATHLASVAEDGDALVWDSAKKGRAEQLGGQKAGVLFVAVNREKSLLVTTSADGKARVFDIKPGAKVKLRATLEGHTREVLHAAISADGKLVATASADRTARVFNIFVPMEKGAEVVLGGHEGPVTFVSFRSSDPRFVATASSDHRGRVFFVDHPDEPLVLTGHEAPLTSIEWNPAGDRLVTASIDESLSESADHAARVWSPQAFEHEIRRRRPAPRGGAAMKRSPRVAAFAEGSEILAAAYDDGTVELADAGGEGKPITFSAPKAGRSSAVTAVIPSPDGERVALAILDIESDTRALYVFEKSELHSPAMQHDVPSAVRHLAWSRKGNLIAAALEDGTAMVFRSDRDAPPVVHRGHTRWVTSVAFDSEGKKLVTTSLDKTALVFEAEGNGEPIARFEHPEAVYAATFDPTGTRIATACANGSLSIFEINRKTEPLVIHGSDGQYHRIVWSADGTRIATTYSTTGAVRVLSGFPFPLNEESPFMLRESWFKIESRALALSYRNDSHRLVAADEQRTYSWGLDIPRLKAELSAENRDCLGVMDRMGFLNEPEDVARRAFDDCEAQEGRSRPPNRENNVASTDLLAARVLILPSGTEVEVNGSKASLRDGFLELWGKPGEKKKVRVIDGPRSTDTEVTIDAAGAKPPVIELEAARPSAGDARAERSPGEFDFDALVPKDYR